MADVLVMADESGNFDFSRQQGATKYLTLCTVTASDFRIGNDLLDLRRRLAFGGRGLRADFHAAVDPQAVRDQEFDILKEADVRVDATLFEKSKAEPHLRTEAALYKMAWFLHFKYVAPRIARKEDRLLVVAASMGTKKAKGAFLQAIQDMVDQVAASGQIGVRRMAMANSRLLLWPLRGHVLIAPS